VSPAHHTRERRWPVLLLVVLVIGLVAGVAGNRGTPVPVGALALPSAQVAAADAESSAWYCTGQSTGSAGSGVDPGQVVLANTTRRPVAATIATVTDTGATEQAAVSVPAHQTVVPSLTAPSSGSWEAQTVTLAGGGVAVSQTVDGSSGWSVAPCQSTTSATWYFAGGSTEGSNGLNLALLNPTSIPVVVDLSFVTPSGTLHPINYQGIVLSPGQLQVENVGTEVQDMSSVSTVVTTRTGRVVASELQVFSTPATGLSLVPGAIVPQAHWVIPLSQEASGGVSELDVFNPGSQTESVTVHLRLSSGPLQPIVDRIAPDSTWILRTSSQTRLPDGATYTTSIDASGGTGVVVARQMAVPLSTLTPVAGLATAVDDLTASSAAREWVVPPPGTSSSPAASGAAPDYLTLANQSGTGEQFAAVALTPSGTKVLASGTLAAGVAAVVNVSALPAIAFDPIVVRAGGPMGVSENVGPTAAIGVVTMPGIPLAEQIGF
jgi:Family of unknown function (DUF5719)